MSLIPWNPFREMDSFISDKNNFMQRMPFGFNRTIGPKIDVYQTETDVVVKAEIPGVSKEDLNIYIDDNSIRLSGETKRDEEFKDDNIYRSERYYGSFSRTVPLPIEVKSDKAKAEYKDGILKITVPKAEPGKIKGRRLDIQ